MRSRARKPREQIRREVTRRFNQNGKILKKVAERSGNKGWWSRERWPTVKQRFFDVSSNSENSWKMSLNSHATVVGGHATVGRMSNNVFSTFQTIRENFEKSCWMVTKQSREGHATVGWLSNNVFSTFQTIHTNFGKSRWTVTRQWSEVTRPLADCQTTLFRRFKQIRKILKKVAERSRDSGRRSRDRWPTVEQRFLDFSSNSKFFWKKSLNVHATVVGGHATVGRLSNNVFSTFQAIRKFFEKKSLNGHATVVGVHATVAWLSGTLTVVITNWLNIALAYACNKVA